MRSEKKKKWYLIHLILLLNNEGKICSVFYSVIKIRAQSPRLRTSSPHFSSGIVERAKRERAWKSLHARKRLSFVLSFATIRMVRVTSNLCHAAQGSSLTPTPLIFKPHTWHPEIWVWLYIILNLKGASWRIFKTFYIKCRSTLFLWVSVLLIDMQTQELRRSLRPLLHFSKVYVSTHSVFKSFLPIHGRRTLKRFKKDNVPCALWRSCSKISLFFRLRENDN